MTEVKIDYNSGDVVGMNDYDRFDTVQEYYSYFRAELGTSQFTFKGGTYYYNAAKGQIEILIHPDAQHYVRIVGDFYKFITDEQGKRTLRAWDSRAISIDYQQVKGFKQMVKAYDGFCFVPENINFQPIVNNMYNLFEPIQHCPTEGDFPYTKGYFQHIFGDSLEMAYDYFSILWRYPTQKLPIISLVSVENGTGKSTLLFLMKAIFGENCTIVGNSEIGSDFNGTYASKLMIGIDESFIDKKTVLEKIKSMNTAKYIWLNEKGVKQKQIACHAHFILTSNNETNFVNLDEHDTRFWIIKVNQPQDKIPNILDKMESEIPAFLHFLQTREISIECEDRFWFKPERFETEAKQRLVEASLPKNVKVLREFLEEYFQKAERRMVHFTRSDLNQILRQEGGTGNFDHEFLRRYMVFYREKKVARKMHSQPYNETLLIDEPQRYITFDAHDYLPAEIFHELFAPKAETHATTAQTAPQTDVDTLSINEPQHQLHTEEDAPF